MNPLWPGDARMVSDNLVNIFSVNGVSPFWNHCHYLNQRSAIVNKTVRNVFEWNLIWNLKVLIHHQNVFEKYRLQNVVYFVHVWFCKKPGKGHKDGWFNMLHGEKWFPKSCVPWRFFRGFSTRRLDRTNYNMKVYASIISYSCPVAKRLFERWFTAQ